MKEMYEVPENLRYTSKHEWIKLENEKIAIVGITDYAQKLLKEVVYVELPEEGKKVEKDESCATVESVKSVSDIFSPMSGEISEVNKVLENEPELINNSPYEQGWLYRLRIDNKKEFDELMDSVQYMKYIDKLSE